MALMDYLLWGLLGVGVVLAWNRANKRLFGDLLSPFNLLLFAWIGPLLLRGFNLSELERPWTIEIVLIFLGVTLGLVSPLIAMQPLIQGHRLAAQRPIFEKTLALFRDWRFIGLMLVCFVVSFSAYIYNDFVTNPVGIPLIALSRDPTIPREAFHRWGRTGGAGIVGLLATPVFILTPMFYLAFRASRRWLIRVFLLGLALLYPIMTLLKLSRIELIQAGVSFVLIEYYYRQFLSLRIRPTRFRILRYSQWAVVAAGLIVGVALFQLAFQQIRGGFTPEDRTVGRLIGYKLDVPDPFYGLAVELYGYFAMPLENFANFYKANPEGGFNPGIGLFRPLLSITGQGRVADAMLEQIDLLDERRLWPVNTYPFITLIHAELGLVGVLVTSVLYAGMVGFFYARFR
jgi:hypothetical protein